MKYLLLMAGIFPFSLRAQTESDIRNHYEQINQQIAASQQQGYEGPLYCDETVVNRHGRSWPAVGIYQETVRYWYDDDPNHVPAAERNPLTVLQKVEVSRRSSALSTSGEYLFRNGRLVFYYGHEGVEGARRETRMYFRGKGVFKSSVSVNGKELSAEDLKKKEYADLKPKPLKVQQEARLYQDLFLHSLH